MLTYISLCIALYIYFMSFSLYFFAWFYVWHFFMCFLCFFMFFMHNFIYPFSYFVCICLGIHGAPQPALPARGVWNYFMYSFICVWKIFLCIPLFIYKMAGTGGSRQKEPWAAAYIFILCAHLYWMFLYVIMYMLGGLVFCSACRSSNIKTCISLCI